MELQRSQAEIEAQLEATTDDYTTHLLAFQLMEDSTRAQQDVESLQAALEEAEAAKESDSDLLNYCELEIAHLRKAVADAEEALVQACEDNEREAKEAERTVHRFVEQVHDQQFELSTQEAALHRAITEAANGRSKAEDSRSRLDAYLSEVDRLKLVEAGIQKQIDDLRRTSALDEMKRMNLSKQIVELEKDKDLLNVALDSKQTELVLLQRSTRPASDTPRISTRKGNFSASSSRVVQTPTPRDVTPLSSRILSASTSSSSLRSIGHRRESLVFSSPATPRLTARTPLGASTKHNTPETMKANAPARANPRPSTGTKLPDLTRRSSLPVLVGRVSTAPAMAMGGSVMEEEDATEVLQ